MKSSSEKILLLRVNDLNNKVKQLDKRVQMLISLMEYTNIKMDEIHNEIFNNSPLTLNQPPKLNRKNSKYLLSKDDSLINFTTTRFPCKAEYSDLGENVPTFQAFRKNESCLPDINKSKYTLMSRRSSNSISS
jgi:hypothetical protein